MPFLRILALALLFSQSGAMPVLAATDWTCMQDCNRMGYQYGYCQAKCSYPDAMPSAPSIIPQAHGTDYTCVNDCTRLGYQYGYCQAKCSY
jgi:hypothetical protein